ncbi:Lysosomal alpha-glucosidase [Halotydeus destructor]|nr:Lysosomal alpha-glucosidase [Halotydeus destructor]
MDYLFINTRNGRKVKPKVLYVGGAILSVLFLSLIIYFTVRRHSGDASPAVPTPVPTAAPTTEPTSGPTTVAPPPTKPAPPFTKPAPPFTTPLAPTTGPPVPTSTEPSPTTSAPGQCDKIDDLSKVDCHPETNASSERCAARGCCWSSTTAVQTDPSKPSTPACFFPRQYGGYLEESRSTGDGKLVINLKRNISSGLPNDITYLSVEITNIDENKVRVKIYDRVNDRFEVPIPPLNSKPKRPSTPPNYVVAVDPDLRLTITRKSTKATIFDTDLSQLIFSDQLLQLSNQVPAHFLYGLGEHMGPFRKSFDWKRYTMKNSDRAPETEQPLYGTHPFYLMVEDGQGTAHGVLLFNNHPMDIILQPKPAVTYRTIGGILDLYIYLGPTAPTVVAQHMDLVGKPDLPPYWSLGFHLCKWGYGTLENTNATMHRNIQAGVPLDVQWNDIESYQSYNDFTFDKETFDKLPAFVDQVHALGMRYVPIVDCGIDASNENGTYPTYDEGQALDIYIKNEHGQNFVGYVWEHPRVWPDFTNPKAAVFWTRQLKKYFDRVPIDGAWTDMNEPANAYDGEYEPASGKVIGCGTGKYDNPPYTPGAPEPINTKTVCMSAQQHLGRHYDLHNMYGIYESKATKEALVAITGKRQFIISRSSATGQGVYGMHWTGDVWSKWDALAWSIPAIMEFNMVGMPMVGADICGFNGNTTVPLCARWSALGAFYPFSRNHNTLGAPDQDPAAMGGVVLQAAKYALGLRYSVIPYLYTLFWRATTDGQTVMRPLFFEFPADNETYPIESQFMLGPSLMVIPALTEDINVSAYLPKGKWYGDSGLLQDSPGSYYDFNITMDQIILARRGGSIITGHPVRQTTTAQRLEPFTLTVYLDNKMEAKGELYWDDGQDPNSILLGQYAQISYQVSNSVMDITTVNDGFAGDLSASLVTVFGLDHSVTSVEVNDQSAIFTFQNETLTISQVIDLKKSTLIKWL